MKKVLRLAERNRSSGSYVRKDYKTDILNSFYHYQEISIIFDQSGNPASVNDQLAEQMLLNGLITQEKKAAYENQIRQSMTRVDQFDEFSMEDLYRHIQGIRKRELGIIALEKERKRRACQEVDFDPTGGIDQRQKKTELLSRNQAILFVLFQAELFFLMKKDLDEARQRGKEIYVLVSGERGDTLPTKETLMRWLGACQSEKSAESKSVRFLEADMDHSGGVFEGIEELPALQQRIDREEACVLAYGEEGLLHCRSLRVDSVVSAIPVGYHARALTNQLSCHRACVVYVPRQLDITHWVRLTEKTRLSYWQLAKLWEAYGDRIYDCCLEELYQRYPQYFLNIYDNLDKCVEAEPDYPIQINLPKNSGIEQFDQLRETAIQGYLNRMNHIRYFSQCLDGPILVHAVRVKKAEEARVVRCEKGIALREMFPREGLAGPAIVSNFLFFLTPKLVTLFNDLRKDRPREQVDIQVGHLDYMLYEKDGRRVETFPLFRKTCIALKENGEFLFFNFRLGGGMMKVDDFCVNWLDTDVDVPKEAEPSGLENQAPVRLYTPYYSMSDRDADRQTYRKPVGDGRINLVILQDKIGCVRKGDVILPGFGVVVSLEEALGQMMLKSLGLQPLEDGYYDAGGLELTVKLDAPREISREEWEQVKWAYGGGLSLILDGKAICDEDMEKWFEEEGWMTPLSRQTQESALHKLEKHPRTAIGTTKNGDLVIIVYSGRTKKSVGADYREMSEIARRMFPDIRTLMNVDGGGSAVLGLVINGSFMELSCPSTSTDSCVGMTRPVNTVLYINSK